MLMRAGRYAAIVVVVAGLSIALAGCVRSPSPAPTPLPLPPVATPTGTPTPGATSTPSPTATFDPAGTAADNLAYFNAVGHALLDHHPNAQGKTIVDWYVARGFDKKAMEITPDKTSIGLEAWNIEFSVNMNGSCLIGQAGNVGFQSTVQPLLATGKCLIGQTRPIDW
jgi:hypothetical protein